MLFCDGPLAVTAALVLAEGDDGGAATALLGRGGREAVRQRMLFEEFGDCAAQHSFAVAVNDADALPSAR